MVRLLVFLFIGLFSNLVLSLSADELRERMTSADKNKLSAEKRLKFLRSESKSTTMLNERDIFYTLPDGRRVEAILLPNGRKSPAIDSRPACLTTSGMLVPGEFSAEKESVVCSVSSAEIAYIDDYIYKSETTSKASSPEKIGVTISKYSNSGSSGIRDTPEVKSSEPGSGVRHSAYNPTAKTITSNPYEYSVPFGSNSQKAEVSTFALSVEKPFGVKRGSWAGLSLRRPVSSADSGSVEYFLTEDVEGDFKVLPVGSILFASKRINESTERLESQVYLAQLPGGEEVKLSGWVYGLNKVAGLPGSLIRDREGESVAAGGNAALAGLRAVTNVAGGGASVAGVVADSYATDMISNEQRYAPSTPGAIIRVSPQSALVQFSEPF